MKPSTPPPPRLPWPIVLVILVLVVIQFLVGKGRVWEDPFNYRKLWPSIYWSYLPIPILVAGYHLALRQLTAMGWLLDTVRVVALKFGITACIMIAIWSAHGPPAAVPIPAPPRRLTPPVPRPEPPARTSPDPSTLGSILGRVVDPSGSAVGDALVFVEGGLERFAYDVPENEIVLENDGTGPRPRLAAVRSGQPVVLRSTDGRLHTWSGVREDGHSAFNYPMLTSAEVTRHELPEALGVVTVTCRAHAGDEAPAWLAVLGHPFAVLASPDGAFRLDGVPAGDLVLSVVATGSPGGPVPSGARGRAAVRVDPAREAGVEIVVSAPATSD